MKHLTILPAAAIALTLSTAALSAQDAQATDAQKDIAPTINFAQAVELAQSAAEGDLTLLEMDYLDETPTYIAELHNKTSESHLVIDAVTGEILLSNVTKAANEQILAEIAAQDAEDTMLDAMAGEFGLRPGDEVPAELLIELLDLEDEMDDLDDAREKPSTLDETNN